MKVYTHLTVTGVLQNRWLSSAAVTNRAARTPAAMTPQAKLTSSTRVG